MEGKHRYIDTKCANMLSAYNHFWQNLHRDNINGSKLRIFGFGQNTTRSLLAFGWLGLIPIAVRQVLTLKCSWWHYVLVPCHPCRRTWSAGVCRGRPWSWGPGWGQRPERAGLGYWPAWSLLRTQSAASDEVSLAELLLTSPRACLRQRD